MSIIWFCLGWYNVIVLMQIIIPQKITGHSAKISVTRNVTSELISPLSSYQVHYFHSNWWIYYKNKKHILPRRKRKEEYKARTSEAKCAEYSEKTSKTIWIFKSSPIEVRLKCRRLTNPLIIGGEMTKPDEFPHMVALGETLNEFTTEYFCAGSLISERWILTAAHCTHGDHGSPKVALLGTTNINKINMFNEGKLISIKKVQIHPDYKPPELYGDLALLELSEPVKFSSTIKPACLYSIPDILPRRLWASGWGASSPLSPKTVEAAFAGINLTKIQLQPIDGERCDKMYRNVDVLRLPRGIDTRIQMCAGDSVGGWHRDTCAGDSGVPLQSKHPLGCLSEIVAITSFGISCAIPNVPGVYTKISYYVDWIESIVWPNDY